MPSITFCLATIRPGRVGGAETYVRGLLKAFRHLSPYTVQVVGSAELCREYKQFGGGPVEIHRGRFALSNRGLKAMNLIVGAAAPLRLSAPSLAPADVVHYPMILPVPRIRAPRIITLHDVRHHDAPADFPRWERLYRSLAYDGPTRRADFVITGSQHSRRRLIEALGLVPARVSVIHHGIDHARYSLEATSESDAALLAPFELPSRFVFYPANLWPHKNHDALLRALARVSDRKLGLVLTGLTYELGTALSDRVAHLGLSDRVVHLGYVPGAVLPALYRRAVGLVFPSRYEGFGAPPLEAMACGCPVAAARSTSVEELCSGASLLFDPADEDALVAAISRLSDDDELRARLVHDGLVRAKQFTWETCAKRHLEVYRAAIDSTST